MGWRGYSRGSTWGSRFLRSICSTVKWLQLCSADASAEFLLLEVTRDLATIKLMGPATGRTLLIASSYLPYAFMDFTPSRQIAALVNPVGMRGLELVIAMAVDINRRGAAQHLQQRCVEQEETAEYMLFGCPAIAME
ncbi:hypothetical protein J6590_028301 [Homalodisca vitripennis]|nr:hypothetical protein J6590_028301 [Homalodisca vitripennis]